MKRQKIRNFAIALIFLGTLILAGCCNCDKNEDFDIYLDPQSQGDCNCD